MHPWLRTVIGWILQAVMYICLFLVVTAVLNDLGNWLSGPKFEQKHANLLGSLGGVVVTAVVAFANFKFQTRTQGNAFKLEVYKLRLALVGKLCRKCHRLMGQIDGQTLLASMDRETGQKWFSDYYEKSETLRDWFTENSVYLPHELFDPFQKFLDSATKTAGMFAVGLTKVEIVMEAGQARVALTRVVQEAQKALNIPEISLSTASILSKHTQ